MDKKLISQMQEYIKYIKAHTSCLKPLKFPHIHDIDQEFQVTSIVLEGLLVCYISQA